MSFRREGGVSSGVSQDICFSRAHWRGFFVFWHSRRVSLFKLISDLATSLGQEHIQNSTPNDIESQVDGWLLKSHNLARLRGLPQYVHECANLLEKDGRQGHKVLGRKTWVENAPPQLPLGTFHGHEVLVLREGTELEFDIPRFGQRTDLGKLS